MNVTDLEFVKLQAYGPVIKPNLHEAINLLLHVDISHKLLHSFC
jgi:hypothetical protein